MPTVEGTEKFLDKLKYETANEVGLPDYASIDKGNLTARENGKVGGNMTKKLIQYAESNLKG
jgi:hypothetical protein